ncbi:MAG: hypothetical protein U0237_00230 [Thermoleophilia bacterium]
MDVIRRLGVCAAVLLAGAATAGAQMAPGSTVLVSRPPGFGPFSVYNGLGNGSVVEAGRDVDASGTHAVFRSDANGLDPSVGADRIRNCFLRDVTGETTVVIDRRVGRAEAADRPCRTPSISGDGSVVVFESDANLLVPGDLDGLSDVFIWDRGTVTALGVPTVWTGIPGFHPDVTVTGSGATRTVHVAFTTAAALVPEDTDDAQDVYVRSFGAEPGTVLVSRAGGPGTAAVGGTWGTISGDATRVAFVTRAALDAADTGSDEDVYVRDLVSGAVIYASRPTGSGGEQQNQFSGARAELSRDGGTVAFTTNATNLGGTGAFSIKGFLPINRVYVRRLAAAQTFPMAVANGSSTTLSPGDTADFAISDDGSRVAFVAAVGGPTPGWATGTNVYTRDVGSTVTTPVESLEDDPMSIPPTTERAAGLSGDGTRMLFARTDPSLGFAGGAAFMQVWLRDLAGGGLVRVSRPDGPAAAPFAVLHGGPSDATTSGATRTVSAGGRFVVFTSSNDLLTGGPWEAAEVYLRDTGTGETRLISTDDGSITEAHPSISADGGTVVYRTTVSLPALGTPAIAVWTRASGEVRIITAPSGSGDHPDLTPDGRFVVFAAPGDAASAVPGQLWLAETATGTVTPLLDPASVPAGVHVTADQPAISGDGTRVAFTTAARLGATDADGFPDVYVLDRPSGRILRASQPADIRAGASSWYSWLPRLDRDGSVVAYVNGQAGDDFGMFENGVVRRVDDGALLPLGSTGPTFAHSSSVLLSDDGTRAAATVAPEGLPAALDSAAALTVVRDLRGGAVTVASRGDGADGVLAAMPLGPEGSPGGDADLDYVAFSTDVDVPGTGLRTDGARDVFLRRVFGPPATPGKPRRTLGRLLMTRRVRAGARPVVRFALGAAGPVRVTVQRAVAGRVSRGRCRAGARVGRPCTAWATVQTRRVAGRKGANTVRLAPRRLAGRYRVRVAVTGGPTRVIPFRVVRTPAR